ncbi:hypothetical protein PGT21_031203 [Puccinia graminis f. sp. tritici]|uniref:Uncharacterized protein n=1 Tax=Puccinia graminis f. sp. tritici TaxID=56615 RepID=A0A5B0QUB4_PUCGR|nr:hypothetical protein PGT21_031203 [Puccinia graminis f. sp. tritici]KAA1116799.1 hypothetical protein PGTUg99_020706 [Puccinia graminis f. sp. tritici]
MCIRKLDSSGVNKGLPHLVLGNLEVDANRRDKLDAGMRLLIFLVEDSDPHDQNYFYRYFDTQKEVKQWSRGAQWVSYCKEPYSLRTNNSLPRSGGLMRVSFSVTRNGFLQSEPLQGHLCDG